MTGSGDTDGGNKRAVVETLDVSKAAATANGNAFSYERIPGAVPPGAASSVFAGYYLPGDPFGWVSISFTDCLKGLMRTLTLALAATALLAGAPAASAADYKVTGGKLDWTMANQYTGGGDAARTWLGYATNTVPVAGPPAAGKVEPTAPATATDPAGAAVTIIDGTSVRGAEQFFTLGYPVAAAGGSYDDYGVGAIELTGTFTFTIHAAQGVKPITIVNPLVTLNGLTGTLHRDRVRIRPATAYDRSKVQFNLDLSGATVVTRADGAKVDRRDRPAQHGRHGALRLPGELDSLRDDEAHARGRVSGARGRPAARRARRSRARTVRPARPHSARRARRPARRVPPGQGAVCKDAKLSTYKLRSRRSTGKAARKVRLLARKTGKLVGVGTLKGRTLKISYVQARKPKGSFVSPSRRQQAARDGDAPIIRALSDRCLDLGDTCR